MRFSKAISYCTCFIVGGFSPAFSETIDLPDGLLFGATFSDVQVIAQSQGWELVQTTFNSNGWSVDTMGLTLYFCNHNLATVDEYLAGGFKEFIDTVWALTKEYGSPETNVTHIPLLGRAISSTFKTDGSLDITVQIVEGESEMKLWTRTTDTSICDAE